LVGDAELVGAVALDGAVEVGGDADGFGFGGW
jgi:hypothetical protein